MSALMKIAYANNNDQGQQFSAGQTAGIGLGAAGLAGGGMYAYHRNQIGKADDKFNDMEGKYKSQISTMRKGSKNFAQQMREQNGNLNNQLQQKAREVEQANGKFNNLNQKHNALQQEHSKVLNENKFLNKYTDRLEDDANNLRDQFQQKAREVEAEKAAHGTTKEQLFLREKALKAAQANNPDAVRSQIQKLRDDKISEKKERIENNAAERRSNRRISSFQRRKQSKAGSMAEQARNNRISSFQRRKQSKAGSASKITRRILKRI